MAPKSSPALLTKRERQIMDVLYRLGRATAAEIMDRVPGAPGYSTVRTQLRVLENKGFFDGSSVKAVAALLGGEAARVSDEELARIAALVKDARSEPQ